VGEGRAARGRGEGRIRGTGRKRPGPGRAVRAGPFGQAGLRDGFITGECGPGAVGPGHLAPSDTEPGRFGMCRAGPGRIGRGGDTAGELRRLRMGEPGDPVRSAGDALQPARLWMGAWAADRPAGEHASAVLLRMGGLRLARGGRRSMQNGLPCSQLLGTGECLAGREPSGVTVDGACGREARVRLGFGCDGGVGNVRVEVDGAPLFLCIEELLVE
jgi:hypothetical protein